MLVTTDTKTILGRGGDINIDVYYDVKASGCESMKTSRGKRVVVTDAATRNRAEVTLFE